MEMKEFWLLLQTHMYDTVTVPADCDHPRNWKTDHKLACPSELIRAILRLQILRVLDMHNEEAVWVESWRNQWFKTAHAYDAPFPTALADMRKKKLNAARARV